MKKNVYAVTGGTGYIGSQLVKHLSKSYDNYIYVIARRCSEVRVIKDNIKYVIYDGTEKSLESVLKKSDYLIHLGALYTTNTDENSVNDLIASNITFSTLLFNVANRVNQNLIISSASTFSAINENGVYAPSSLYAATKKAVEDIAHYYSNLSIHFLTFPDTYGPGDWRPKIHNMLINNKSWPFIFRNRENQEIRLLHVEDVIGHLLKSLEQTDKGVHIHDIYSEGVLLTLKELSELITDKKCLFNKNAELTNIPKMARKISKSTGHNNIHNKITF
ncbi:MAG TPA: NAD(P)-dependent oxidoreductase [Clostridiales bacterium]|nr:NAD(P)-dependent oxidoreductase [Clostridiales bacterium]